MKINLNKCRCATCGGPMYPIWSEKTQNYVVYENCLSHVDKYDVQLNRLEEHRFFFETPSLFRETELNKLPSDSVVSGVNQLMSEDRGYKQSVILHGLTGSGKSRAAWLLANHYFFSEYPRRPLFMNPRRLDSWLVGSFSESVKQHEINVQKMCDAGLLVIDDLGKERLTPRMETDIFSVIDDRISRKLPTIITTNYNGRSLLERFPNKETGVALIRRFREHFRFISSAAKETVTE